MNIVLDTNIIRHNLLMNSEEFNVLFDYLKKTASKIKMPEIVYKELLALYERELKFRYNQYNRHKGSLGSILINESIDSYELDTDKKIREYNAYLDKKIGLSKYNKIVPLKDEYFKDVVERAVNRIKPCSEGGRGFRDSLIWLSVLDIAKETEEKIIIFISNNTKDFASDNNTLHEYLLKETKKNKVSIKYYSSIAEFIKDHAVTIDFITSDWLNSVVNVEKINDEVLKYLELYEEDRILERTENDLEPGERVTGYANPLSCNLGIDDFYIYEKTDGSLYVSVDYYGEIEAEVEIEKEVEVEDEDVDYEYSPIDGKFKMTPRYYSTSRIKSVVDMKYTYPDVTATYGITIKDKKITDIELESVDI